MVIWSKTAKAQLRKAYNYIVKDSLQNAQIVRDKIIELTIDLSKHPEKYPRISLNRIMTAATELLKFTAIGFLTG